MDPTINDALRTYRKNKLTIRDGQSRDEINAQLREAVRGETFTVPADPPERKRRATNDEISEALRRLAGKG